MGIEKYQSAKIEIALKIIELAYNSLKKEISQDVKVTEVGSKLEYPFRISSITELQSAIVYIYQYIGFITFIECYDLSGNTPTIKSDKQDLYHNLTTFKAYISNLKDLSLNIFSLEIPEPIEPIEPIRSIPFVFGINKSDLDKFSVYFHNSQRFFRDVLEITK